VVLKTQRRDLYFPPAGRFVDAIVPELTFLAVDGHGDPNTSPDYRHAVEALFAVSYAAKFLSRRELDRDDVVLPLEGLWSSEDWTAFVRREKDAWTWTMLIRQPEWVDAAMLRRAQEQDLPAHEMAPTGRHHEIYLSDPRRTHTKLRTVLRQPVIRAGPVSR